eukprot:774705_1
MTMGRRKLHASRAATVVAIALLATTSSCSALNFGFGSSSKDAESDANNDPAAAPANPHMHQQPSDPLPGQEVNEYGQPTYGADVSFPIHHEKLSDNYAWLPHNLDPENNPTPKKYAGKPVQYLGNKQ